MTPEGERLLADIIAKEKAALDKKLAREPDVTCQGCTYRWSLTPHYHTAPRPPVWIDAAQGYWHLRCWQMKKERDMREAEGKPRAMLCKVCRLDCSETPTGVFGYCPEHAPMHLHDCESCGQSAHADFGTAEKPLYLCWRCSRIRFGPQPGDPRL